MFGWLRSVIDFIKSVIPKDRRKVKVLDARGDVLESKKRVSDALKNRKLN